MSENSLNAKVTVSADASPVQNLIGVLKKLEKVSADLANALPAATEALAEFGGAAEATAEASDKVAKSAKNINKSVGDSAKVEKSTQNLKGYVKTVNDLREVLGKGGPKPQNLFGSTKEAAGEIKELEGELLKLVNVYRTGFGQEKLKVVEPGTVAELEQFRETVKDTFASIKVPEEAISDVTELRQEIDKLSGSSDTASSPLGLLADLPDARDEAKQTADAIEDLQRKLRELGPAAEAGNEQAIKDFGQLSIQLKESEANAKRLINTLKDTGNILDAAIGGVNQSLGEGGFKKITLEDIFPSEEQRKVQEMQRKISSAVAESVKAGAVQKTLQLLTGNGKKAGDATEALDRNIVQLTSHLPRMRYALYDVSNSLAVFGGGLLAASVGAVKLFADFDRAFADVLRTTGLARQGVEAEAAALKKSLIDISQELPVAFGDVAEIATLAGQLNIANESIGNFTENVAKFAATSDVTIEAAATAFGRLDQLVEGVDGQFDKLGSSILAVGVNAVATESDIIAISTQIASVANIAGFSASELIGFSSALASVGTRPELARGTFTRLFTEIQQSVAQGGDQLNAFASIAGQSVDQFTAAWGAGSGADQVLAILRGLQAEGKTADQALAKLGITSVRDVPTLLKLAQSVEEVDRQIRIANLGFAEGSELQEQYNVITSTLSEKVVVLKNNLAALGAAFGSVSGPLTSVIDVLIKVTKAFEEILDNPVNSFIAGTITSFVGLLGVLGLFGSLVARVTGGFVGFATAMIEGFEAIGLMKISMDQATVSTTGNTVATEKNKQSKLAKAIADVRAAKAQDVETASTNANTVSKNALSVATMRAVAATRAFRAALGGLAVGVAITGVFLIIDAISKQIDTAEDAVDANEKLAESLGDIAPFMSAIEKDTDNYRKATMEARREFDTFGGSVKANNIEISDRGAILAVVTGQEELLAGAAGKTADEIQRQTFAIGENTEALIRQKLARDLATAALEDEIGVKEVRTGLSLVDITTQEGGFGFSQSAFLWAQRELERTAEGIGLASLFEIVTDPALSDGLTKAGFDFQNYIDAVVSGNDELAASVLTKLKPAAEELLKTAKEGSDVETYLKGVIEFGTQGLQSYTSAGSKLRNAIKELVFEQQILGGAFDDTGDAVETFRDAMKGAFEDAFAPINAQRAMEDSIRSLGTAFAEESPEVVVNSEEMQSAIAAIIDTASNEDEAVEGLQGLYAAILDGGYASREELELLGKQIIDTYTIAAQARLQALKDSRALTRSGSEVRTREQANESRALDQQIGSQEQAIENIKNIASGTANSAEQANLLAQGYTKARNAASGAKDEVKEIEEVTEKVTRTLSDYASDLESIFSRAFDIRFGAGQGIDDIADTWLAFTEQVEDAQMALEELQATQEDLGADRAIKEYFLSVADAYGDVLRAATLRNEISDLDKQQAENAKALAEAQDITGNANSVSGDSPQGRQNRQALLGLVQNYQSYIGVLAESGASQDELRDATAKAKAEFIDQARELGFAEDSVQLYAQAFDDVTFAINNVPRNITVDFNANPALQALNELNAKLDQSINKARELNNVTNTPNPAPLNPSGRTDAEVKRLAAQWSANLKSSGWPFDDFASGGFTGRGGKMDPAGIVHKGEYVVPKQFVNQSTGMPDANFLAQLQNGMRSYAMGGFVGGQSGGNDGGTMMVELSPFDRKLLSDAGNVQLRLNGKVVAEATNANNFNEARRGSN